MSAADMNRKKRICENIGEANVCNILFPIDVARRLGISKSSVLRLDSEGVFPAHMFEKNGVQYRYYMAAECDAFVVSPEFLNWKDTRMARKRAVCKTIHDFGVDLGTVYTAAELAEKFSVSRSMIDRWTRSGLIQHSVYRHVSRSYVYYTEEQVEEFSENGFRTTTQFANADLIGTSIGKLDILGFSEASVRSGYYGSYICKCACGNTVEVPRSELLAGKRKSCGCKFHDLTGKTFGRWHVDSQAPFAYTPSGYRLFQYACTCACGTKRIVTATSLTSGASQSCGCLHKEVVSERHLKNLTGRVFGDLTVQYRAETHWSRTGHRMKSMWHCVCACGSELDVSSENLLSGRIDSCGCGRRGPNTGASKCEFDVRKYLESIGLFENEFDGFVQYQTYPDLVGVGGGYLLYDFYVTCGDHKWLIECQGAQHYRPVEWFGGQAKFEIQQEHDKRKREYAEKIGVPLIEVPYTLVSYDDVANLLRLNGIV